MKLKIEIFSKKPSYGAVADAKDTFETIDDEISGQEALEFVADWSVSAGIGYLLLSLTRNKKLYFYNQT